MVARLLSGSDQRVGVGADAPPTCSPEPAPIASELFTTGCPPVAGLPADSKERAVPSPSDGRALLPYSNRAVWSTIIVLAVLIFGAGLAVGYGILGRNPKIGSSSAMQEGEPVAARNNAISKTVDDQDGALNAAVGLSVNPTVNSPEPNTPPLRHGHAGVLADNERDGEQQTPAAQGPSERSEQTHPMIAAPRVPADSHASGNSSALVKPDAGQTAAQPESTHLSRPPPSDGSTTTLETSTQPVHPEGVPPGSTHSENVPPTTKAPATPGTTALAGLDAGPLEAHAAPGGLPDEPVGSLGQIDPCQLVHSVHPVYPENARKLHVEGNVELRVVVGVDGAVRSVGLVSGPPLLVMAAIDAAREFRYKPALLNGKPIETVQTIDMSFKLKN